jgi:hypothetical protein
MMLETATVPHAHDLAERIRQHLTGLPTREPQSETETALTLFSGYEPVIREPVKTITVHFEGPDHLEMFRQHTGLAAYPNTRELWYTHD